MRRAKRATWWLSGLVVAAVHLLLLLLLARWTPALKGLWRGGPREVVPVILWPLRRIEPAARTSGRPLRPHQPSAPSPSAPPELAVPAAAGVASGSGGAGQGPRAALGWPDISPNLFRRIRPSVGCAHPEAYRLSQRELDRCNQGLGELARTAPDLGVMTPPGKAAAYAQALHCRRVYYDNDTPTGNQPSTAGLPGLGYVPSIHRFGAGKAECPPDAQ
jgi:hypothetical protein